MAVAKEKKICNNKKNVFNWQEFVTAELGKNLEWILAMNGLREQNEKCKENLEAASFVRSLALIPTLQMIVTFFEAKSTKTFALM